MKRAPTKKRLAMILDKESNVAGMANDYASWHRVEVYEEGVEEASTVPLDDEDPAQLEDVLDELGVTDLVAAWYEDRIFGQLKGEGFSLWLIPPETSMREAINEWHENVLTPAQAGAMLMREGRLRHSPPIERRP